MNSQQPITAETARTAFLDLTPKELAELLETTTNPEIRVLIEFELNDWAYDAWMNQRLLEEEERILNLM